MASEKTLDPARRKRVERLKKIIITTVILLILIPTLLCIVLLFRMNSMEKKLRGLEEQLEILSLNKSVSEKVVLSEESTSEHVFLGTAPTDAPICSESEDSVLADDRMPGDSSQTESDYRDGSSGMDGGAAEPGRLFNEQLLAKEQDAAKRVYLTFDDGPSSNTGRILDILDEYGIKATFFVNLRDSEYEPYYKEIVDRGHTIGMHSASHNYSAVYASEEAFAADLDTIRKYIYEQTGVYSNLYRFPGGSSNHVSKTPMKKLADLLDYRGIRYFDWNCMSSDATNIKYTPEQLCENVLDTLPDERDIVILMHDAKEKDATVESLPLIIEALSDMDGVEFFPITPATVPVQHEIFIR